jgi:hypothetical protein
MIKEYLEQSKQIYLVIAFYIISNFITMKFMSSSGKFNKPWNIWLPFQGVGSKRITLKSPIFLKQFFLRIYINIIYLLWFISMEDHTLLRLLEFQTLRETNEKSPEKVFIN